MAAAALNRMSARSAAGVSRQKWKAPTALSSARSASALLAAATLPTTSEGRAGLVEVIHSPVCTGEPSMSSG